MTMVTHGLTGPLRFPNRVEKEPRPIVVLSSIIIDEITLPNGHRCSDIVGGAGMYSAAGAAAWWPSVAIVAGIGRDDSALISQHLVGLGLRTEGLLVRDEHTIRNQLRYRTSEERTETTVLGIEHFNRMQLTLSDVPDTLLPATGTYFFGDLRSEFWTSLRRMREQLGTTLWELNASVANAADAPRVKRHLREVDIFSLNLAEARRLLGIEDPLTVVSELLEAGTGLVALRMGASGALIGSRHLRVWMSPPPSRVVDVTGAGNTFCGALLASWCVSRDIEFSARAAAAAAAQCIANFGPPTRIDHESLETLASTSVIRTTEP
jgi:sugar/nucleoside kinase (ribokinase family)